MNILKLIRVILIFSITISSSAEAKKGYYNINVRNNCDSTIWVLLNYINDSNEWITDGWWKLVPGETGYLADTKNRYFYHYAESEEDSSGDKYYWSNDFYKDYEGETYGLNENYINMQKFGKYTLSLSCDSDLPKDWNPATTYVKSKNKKPMMQICIRDYECEDGDILSVTLNGNEIMNEELFNEPSCGYFEFNKGNNVIDILAVNGTGYKGNCSYRDANSGEISISPLSSKGKPINTQIQTWQIRSGKGSMSKILVNSK